LTAGPAYDVLALDIDGTLLRNDRTISERTRKAIREVRSRGVRLVLVTGRRNPAARRVAEALGESIPLVLHNGALVIEGGEIVDRLFLPKEKAGKVIRLCREADPVAHVGSMGEGQLWVEGGPSRTLRVYSIEKSHKDVRVVPDLEAALEEDPVQIMFGGTIAEVQELSARISEALPALVRLEKTLYPAFGVGLLDVLHPNVSKGRALGVLLERWGVARERALAIGDNWNDRPMLEGVGLGLVMGNADPALHDLGFPVLPSNEEDGVAHALERYLL
jgi:Cof subfamily protein (haloacid dehalogenase superfamily)